jgi:multidrug efflux system outer membrane protein
VLHVVGEEWWGVFRDPELDRLEHLTLDANQDFRRAIARIRESRLQARIIAADFFPHFDLTNQYSRSVTSDDGPLVRDSVFGNPNSPSVTYLSRSITQNAFEGDLRMSWEVDVFGRIQSAYVGGQARAQAAIADMRGVRLSVTTELAAGYFTLRSVDEQVSILGQTADLRRESLRLNEARTGVGIGLPDDVARARLELHDVEAQLANARRQRNELESNLALLCGQPAPDFHIGVRPLRGVCLPGLSQELPAALLTRRPDVAAAERRLAAALQDIRRARAEELPRVTVSGYIGQMSEEFDRFANHSSHEAAIMPVISIPVFEGGRLQANERLAIAQRDQAAADYKETVLTGFREAETALDDIRQRALEHSALERAVADAQVVLNFSNDRYAKQTVSYFQVVTDEANLLSAQLQATIALNAQFTATVSLARALGGGWPEEAEPSPPPPRSGKAH